MRSMVALPRPLSFPHQVSFHLSYPRLGFLILIQVHGLLLLFE